MSVLNRPMFRQAGGPAAPMPQDMAPPMPPPPMPPPMASEMAGPPPEIAMLEQAEAGAMAQGQELGAAYAQQMMAGIDGAQSTEDLINALRGNEMTLGDRRDELAEYVGQSDADKTPESVLAMVQPVIMMTEEGMMNSGIGALVQQIAGDVDMATEGGQPTDMGMGVGSLMMAGAQEAPAPQNFRQGGAVQKFDNGGAALRIPEFKASEVLRQYGNLLPVFEEITSGADRAAEAEEQKKMDELQFLLSAARGGLRLAAGDPKAGSSFASQVGAAFEPTAAEMAALGAAAQKRRTDIRAEDRALRSAALQGAMGLETQRLASEYDILQAQIAAQRQNYNLDTYVKPRTDNPETEVVESGLETRTVDPRDAADIAKATEAGFVKLDVYRAEMGGDKPPKPMIIVNSTTGEVVANIDLSTSEGLARRAAMTPNERMESPRTQSAVERAVVILDDGSEHISTTGGLSYVEDGVALETPTGAQVLKGQDLTDHLKTKAGKEKYSTILESTLTELKDNPNTVGLDPLTLIVQSAKKGVNIGTPMTLQGGNVVPARMTDPEVAEIIQNLTPDVFQAALDGTGPLAAIQSTADRLLGAAFDPSFFIGDTARTQQAKQNLRALMILARSSLIDEDSKRYVVAENEAIGSLFADPDSFFQNPETQAAKLSQLKQAVLNRYVSLLQRGSIGELGSGTSGTNRQQKINQLATVLRLMESVPIAVPIDQKRQDDNQARLDILLGIGDQD